MIVVECVCASLTAKFQFTEKEVIIMLEFVIENIFVEFGEHIFNKSFAFVWYQTVQIFYEAEFTQKLKMYQRHKIQKLKPLISLSCVYRS